MKLKCSALALSLQCNYFLTAAKSDVGHVYLFNPDSSVNQPTTQPQSLPLDSALLIIAERLGLSQFYSLGELGEAAINQLNDFSNGKRSTLRSLNDRESEHALVIIEGVKSPEKLWPKNIDGWSQFRVSDPPSAEANRHLLDGLLSQTDFTYPKDSRDSAKENAITKNLQFWKSNKDELLTTSGPSTFRHIRTLEQYASDSKGTYTSMSENLILHMERLARAARSNGYSLTVLLMPPSAPGTNRRSFWGKFDEFDTTKHMQRRQQPQTSLSPGNVTSTQVATSGIVAPTGPVRGILPSCFKSQEDCVSKTHDCSGHGKCGLKRKAQAETDSDCYACACEPQVSEDGRTVNYGGPACQKRDIVVPFWLLAGSSIGLITVVSLGIGLLFSMGNEELPSVIGAGVSGPRAK